MLDSTPKAVRLFALVLAIGGTACGADTDYSNPVPVKDAGVDAPPDAPADAKADGNLPSDSGANPTDAADASD